ncbi:hypothetical protein COU00_02440, partial [Candidatus Falkowbacteria bacterium CG10_big_fil_rev_8_21_14_0_10_43_11]
MNALDRDIQWDWQKPELTRAGQTKFWDRQAPTYDLADMTTDNSSEINEVIKYCCQYGYQELITLGSAIGCRDPKMIFKQAYCGRSRTTCTPPNSGLPQVFFNDLSETQVERAKKEILARCQQCGARIKFYSGPIHEICGQAGRGSRTLLLGVYNIESFFNADPCHDYPLAGFDEYLKNAVMLGDYFWFDWLILCNGILSTKPADLELSATASQNKRESFRQILRTHCWKKMQDGSEAIALQIVGVLKNKDGFFISHWYGKEGLCRLLSMIFSPNDYDVPPPLSLAKGFLVIVKRKNAQSIGVITMLNNVLGNIIPEEQLMT